MAKFISNNLEIIVAACAFGAIAFYVSSQRAGSVGDRSVGGSVALAVLMGDFVQVLPLRRKLTS